MDRMNWDGTPQGFDQDRPELAYTDEVRAATDHLYDRVKDIITPMEWPAKAPLVHAINQLKKEKNAVILAHNYMTADIFHCVGDLRGDSLALARMAAESEADIIVQAGRPFHGRDRQGARTGEKGPHPRHPRRLLPRIVDHRRGRAPDQAAYPGVPVVTYVNTSAEVKAECDICCTSSNAVQVVESLGADTVILLPDQYLAKNVAAQTDVRILTWAGSCEVHEKFTAQDIQDLRDAHPGVLIITHPESPLEVVPGRRLCRLDRRHGRLCPHQRREEGGTADRVLDERQCRRRGAGRGIHPPVQSVPAHEADHAGKHL